MSVGLEPDEKSTVNERLNKIEPEMHSRQGSYSTPIPSASLQALLEPVLMLMLP